MVKTLRVKYYTPNEVCMHNTGDDLWVSFLGKVLNLTPLCQQYQGSMLLKPIIQAAGTDISHWFNSKTHDVRTYVDPITECTLPYTPYGRFVHVAPPYPCSDYANDFGQPWWRDDSYCIGLLSAKTRRIKVVNILTSQDHVIEVCSEELLSEIQERYLPYNQHAASYTWKYNGINLDMEKTLEQNGIADEDDQFCNLRMDDNEFLQVVHVYFNDDLTEA